MAKVKLFKCYNTFEQLGWIQHVYLFLFGRFCSPEQNRLVLEDPIRTEDEQLSDSSFFRRSPCYRQVE